MPLPPASLDTEVEAGGELDQALQRRQWVMGDELVLDVPSQTPQEDITVAHGGPGTEVNGLVCDYRATSLGKSKQFPSGFGPQRSGTEDSSELVCEGLERATGGGPSLPLSCAPKTCPPREVVDGISHLGFFGGKGDRLKGEDDGAVAQ